MMIILKDRNEALTQYLVPGTPSLCMFFLHQFDHMQTHMHYILQMLHQVPAYQDLEIPRIIDVIQSN